jgi:hypothetical protein
VAIESLPLRAAIGDPFDLARRPSSVGVSALTLRVDRAARTGTFILHWRDPARVASGGGLHQVMPVGVFQPTSGEPRDVANDFDLWRNLVREYSEELLGEAERGAEGLDYDEWPFYRAMTDACRSGAITAHCFGVGIDPLTLVGDVLMVVAFDAEAYDDLLDGVVTTNEEGTVVTLQGGSGHGVPFDADSVREFIADKPMQPAGAAVLDLAASHRDLLLGAGHPSRGRGAREGARSGDDRSDSSAPDSSYAQPAYR